MSSDTTNATFLFDNFNKTLPEMYRRTLPMRILGSSFTLLLGVSAVLGNLAVVFVSFSDQALRNQASNLLIVYLATTDALTGFFSIIPSSVFDLDYWPFGKILCRLQNGVHYGCMCSSSFNISLISLDRAVAVMRPLQYHSIMHSKTFLSFGVALFLLALTLLVPSLVLDWSQFNYYEGKCAYDWSIAETKQFTASWSMVSCYYIPAVCKFFCNLVIVIAASRKRNKITIRVARGSDSAHQQIAIAIGPKMNKAIAGVFVLVVTYSVTLAPIVISKQIAFATDVFSISPQVQYLFSILSVASSAVNPFFYGIFRDNYRRAFKKIASELKINNLP
ncbi:neuropeptides B/W receptor type 2-like [Uloborus diversus]|uniref:neuropeptides B/W receptor type 2-like n=1 Tax=Uloborus diversus TaxID=327109 RepID=UPI002408FB3C|nr:neuropeptides B/W receptor type 2-like [Uloborus diversus]